MTERLVVTVVDPNNRRPDDAELQLSRDDGKTWVVARIGEPGFELESNQRFVLRATAAARWPVQQSFRLSSPSTPQGESSLLFEGPADFGAGVVVTHARGAVTLHRLTLCLSLYRNANDDLVNREKGLPLRPAPDPAKFGYPVYKYRGLPALEPSGFAGGRLAADVQRVDAHQPALGDLYFLQGRERTGYPELVAVYVPKSIDWHADEPRTPPVPLYVFLCPGTHRKVTEYPYGADNQHVFFNYLTGEGKRLIPQVNASGKQVVLVFPLPPPSGYFSKIESDLRGYAVEIAYWLLRSIRGVREPEVRLGRCAVSGYSQGGDALLNVLKAATPSGPTGPSPFYELKEAYAIDAATTLDPSTFFDTLRTWMSADQERVARVYTHFDKQRTDHQSSWLDAASRHFGTPPSRISGPGREWQTDRETFLWVPNDFFLTAVKEEASISPVESHFRQILGYDPSPTAAPLHSTVDERSVHQAIPGYFVQHALRNSRF